MTLMPSISTHSKPHTMYLMRRLKHFVLQHSVSKTKQGNVTKKWWTTHWLILWMTMGKSKLLQGEDIKRSGGCHKTINCDAINWSMVFACKAQPLDRGIGDNSTILVKAWAVWHHSNPIVTLKLEGTKLNSVNTVRKFLDIGVMQLQLFPMLGLKRLSYCPDS